MNRRLDRWVDGWMGGWTNERLFLYFFYTVTAWESEKSQARRTEPPTDTAQGQEPQ